MSGGNWTRNRLFVGIMGFGLAGVILPAQPAVALPDPGPCLPEYDNACAVCFGIMRLVMYHSDQVRLPGGSGPVPYEDGTFGLFVLAERRWNQSIGGEDWIYFVTGWAHDPVYCQEPTEYERCVENAAYLGFEMYRGYWTDSTDTAVVCRDAVESNF